PPEDCLDSWKEIADYLGRQVRTVQRWEKSEGMPIDRHFHGKAGTVKAYKSEIDAWLQQRHALGKDPKEDPKEDSDSDPGPAAAEGELRKTSAPPFSAQRRHLRYIAAFILGIAVAIGLVFLSGRELRGAFSRKPGRIILAVKPFQGLGGNPDEEAITQGFTEEMLSRLDLLHPERLGVLKLPASYADISPDQISSKFKADYILEGSVRMDGQKFAITARLMEAKDGTHVWGNSYEGDLQESIAMQNKVAFAVALEVLDNLPHPEPPAVHVNRDAEVAYLQGRYFWDKRTAESLSKAVDLFRKSIQIDPGYAPAYSGLADSYSLLGTVPNNVIPPAEAFPKAEDAARRALQLDESLAEAHVVLGYSNLVYEWKFQDANREFQRALQLQPKNANAHHFYAYYLTATGQLEKATEEAETALNLDPVSPILSTAVGETLYQRRLYDRAIGQNRAALMLDQAYLPALVNLGRAFAQKGMHQQARDAFQKILTFVPEDPAVLSLLANDYAVSGDKAAARKVLIQLQNLAKKRYVPSLYIAVVHAGLGENDQAFQWLEKAYQERCDYLVYLPSEPLGDTLRSDPRYAELIHRLGLQTPPAQMQ
ncbi:MAG: tetratricopeptide repeat protein, partial [Acidobacteriia bacterium]|nr:tetratricopeptide repeat protein [Terriglobia bacterium]